MIVLPGGFGTLDELFEFLTLRQTGKLAREIRVVLYGTEYWQRVVNLDAPRRGRMVDREHLRLLHRADSVEERCAAPVETTFASRRSSGGPQIAHSTTGA